MELHFNRVYYNTKPGPYASGLCQKTSKTIEAKPPSAIAEHSLLREFLQHMKNLLKGFRNKIPYKVRRHDDIQAPLHFGLQSWC